MARLYDFENIREEGHLDSYEIPGEVDVFVSIPEEMHLFQGHVRHLFLVKERNMLCNQLEGIAEYIPCTHPGHSTHRTVTHSTTAKEHVTCQHCLEWMHA